MKKGVRCGSGSFFSNRPFIVPVIIVPVKTNSRPYRFERTKPVPAVVFACLVSGELRIELFPGVGLSAGAYLIVPIDKIPRELRMPNTLLWVQFDESMEVSRVWKRDS